MDARRPRAAARPALPAAPGRRRLVWRQLGGRPAGQLRGRAVRPVVLALGDRNGASASFRDSAAAPGRAADSPPLRQADAVRRGRRGRLHASRLLGRELHDRDQRDAAELFAAAVRGSAVVAVARADRQRQTARRADAVARRSRNYRQRREPADARSAHAQSRRCPASRRRVPLGDLHRDPALAPAASRVVVPVHHARRCRGDIAAVLRLGDGDGENDDHDSHGRGDDRVSRDIPVDRRLPLLERGGDHPGTERGGILQSRDPGLRNPVRGHFSRRAAARLHLAGFVLVLGGVVLTSRR